MIKLISDSRTLLLEEKRLQKLLAIFNEKNYITSKAMRHFETDQLEALSYTEKLVCVGLSSTQKMIVKGYNILFNRDIRTFDNQEEAVKYLLNQD